MMEDFQNYLELINNCDLSDPLLSETTLGKRLDQIPLSFVNRSDMSYMTQALNSEQLIPTEAGLARDYRGLAELMGFSSVEIENCIKRSYNPTRSLLDAYMNANKDVTVNHLLKLIENIERFDVIDDTMPILVELASRNKQLQVSAIKDDSQALLKTSGTLTSTNDLKNFNRLTINDRPHEAIIIYDAFICYAPEDINYARELSDLLEANDKSVTTADDLLPGHFEHDALVRLIDNRCRKVIIILTPNFSRSKECEFQTKFASEIGIKADSPKIIPVLYEACDDTILPSMIKVLSKIDMTNQASREWQLHRLIRSLNQEHEMQSINNRGSFSRLNGINSLGRTSDRQMANAAINLTQPLSCSQTHNDGPIPAITFSNTTQIQNTETTSSGPIIEIMQSESSSSDLEVPQASGSGPINWFRKKFTRQILRCEQGVSTTSQSPLISSDYADKKYQRTNGGI